MHGDFSLLLVTVSLVKFIVTASASVNFLCRTFSYNYAVSQ